MHGHATPGTRYEAMGACGSKPPPAKPHAYQRQPPPPRAAAVDTAAFRGSNSIPAVWRTHRVRAQGVGSAFERLDEQRRWQPIGDIATINALGKLCAGEHTGSEVYAGKVYAGEQCTATQTAEGLIKESWSQAWEYASGVRMIRLVPFFFEFENGPRDWKPCTDPEACMALTAVLVSSSTKTYKVTSWAGEQRYEAQCVDDKGLLLQRNVATGKLRRIRTTPVGPDGAPHFEFLDNGDLWQAVDPVCVKILAAATTGLLGECAR